MAVTDYSEVFLQGAQGFNPYHINEVVSGQYVNKAWDSSRGEWVYWTTDHIDFQGVDYPHTTWGSTSGYAVEKIITESV